MTTTAARATLVRRPLTDGELPEFLAVVSAAFLSDPGQDPLAIERSRAVLDPGRTLGVFDDSRLLGGGAILTREMTLPGSGPSPVAAVSHVGVRPDARGRGALTALIRAQLTGLHESGGEPVAVLWASMAPIYGRFGYGLASRRGELCVPARAPFREGSPAGGTVRWLDEAGAAESMRAIHRGLVAGRVGWVSRPEVSWRWALADPESGRGGATAYRYALHLPRGGGGPDGYAVFRAQAGLAGRRAGLRGGHPRAGRGQPGGSRGAVAFAAGPRHGRQGAVPQRPAGRPDPAAAGQRARPADRRQ
jgi:predicted N-acetyltransferase YhbS